MKKRTREPQGKAREKYVGMRAGFSNNIYLDEVLDQQFKMHMGGEYRNEAETEALLKITGYTELLKKTYKWTRGKEDWSKFFGLAEGLRYDKAKGLSKADATARFMSGKAARPIKNSIPSEFKAKPTTPYIPRPGSSSGKVFTKMSGAVMVEKDLRAFFKSILALGNKGKVDKMSVNRTMSKTINIK